MILVTGGAGYIGSHCVLNLIQNGFDVVIFDNLELGHLEIVQTLQKFGKVDFLQGDLKNPEDIKKIFNKHKIDAVIHFAAYSQVSESMRNPQKYYTNNVCGTLNLLNAMIENNVDKMVFSSTAAVYGEPSYVPIDENHPQNPINPYGQSKFVIEKILDDYDKAYKIKSVRLRYFNVAGADSNAQIGEIHMPETHLIPNILNSSFENSKVFEIYGTDYETVDGTCVRDYINVEDLANAHKLATEYLLRGGKTDFFNIGTNNGNSVKEVFSLCENITGQKIPLEIKSRREGDPAVLVANNDKVFNILGWKPQKDLEYSIKTAYEWAKICQGKSTKIVR